MLNLVDILGDTCCFLKGNGGNVQLGKKEVVVVGGTEII